MNPNYATWITTKAATYVAAGETEAKATEYARADYRRLFLPATY